MKYTFTFLLITAFIFNIFSQENNEKAKKIISNLSAKTKSYKSIYIDFTAKIKNSSINETQKGKAWMKGEMYKVHMGDYTILCNGIKIWTISNEDKEVYLSTVGEDEDETINPKKLLTLWQKGYKYKYVDEKKINDKNYYIINLHPKNPNDSKYHTITMFINSKTSNIYQLILKSKDATISTYTIKEFKVNESYSNDFFIFDKRNFINYEVIE